MGMEKSLNTIGCGSNVGNDLDLFLVVMTTEEGLNTFGGSVSRIWSVCENLVRLFVGPKLY